MKKICLILILTFIISCVYFNTFFNAKKYYAEALAQKEKNDNKISPTIKQKFYNSIEKCTYVIKEYPKSKYVDDALLLIGKCFYEQENYIKALKKFQEFEQYYSDCHLYPEAKLYLAKTYLKLKKYDEAQNQFNAIFNNNQFQKVREQAYIDLSDYYIQEEDYLNAKTIVLDLIKANTSKESYLNALYSYAQIIYLSKDYENAEIAFKKVLSSKPEKRMKLDTKFYLGNTYIELEKYNKALKLFEKLKKDETNNDRIQEINLQIGICYAYLGDTEKAFTLFEKTINENKGSQIVSKIYYYWGDIYFSLLYDYTQAVEKLQKVTTKNLEEELAVKTSNKIKIANQFINYKSKQKTNQILELADSQFQIAEYYNLDLFMPDSAITIYEEIANQLNVFYKQLDSLNTLLDSLTTDSLSANISEESRSELEKLPTGIFGKQDSLISIKDSLTINNEQDSINFIKDALKTITQYDTLQVDSLKKNILEETTFNIQDSLILTTDSLIVQDTIKLFPDTLINDATQKISRKDLLTNIKNLEENIAVYKKEIYPKALFMKVWTYIKLKNDTLMAKEVFDDLSNEFPNSKYTNAALYIINNEPFEIFFQDKDEAQTYFNKSLDYYFDLISFDKSIGYLDTILTMYQTSPIYPKALCLKAYLLIQEKSDTAQAKPYLEELVTDYPDMELTKDIKSFFDGNNYIQIASTADSMKEIAYTITDSIITPDTLIIKQDETPILDSLIVIETDISDSIKVEEISETKASQEQEVTSQDTLISTQSFYHTHTVLKGECLWIISGYPEIYNDPFKWTEIYRANADKIEDPDLIYPNQILQIPRN
ncbi:MAG: tetratricopeptide repeat protein [Candidatus Cloacimonetes bacterium]|nr:tetratricopeptide repeat protein [Candidatus Cloacimonadota bacterium]